MAIIDATSCRRGTSVLIALQRPDTGGGLAHRAVAVVHGRKRGAR
jgi:hypothetical protein